MVLGAADVWTGCMHLTIRLGIWLAVKLEGTIQEQGAWTRQASDGPGDMGVLLFFFFGGARGSTGMHTMTGAVWYRHHPSCGRCVANGCEQP